MNILDAIKTKIDTICAKYINENNEVEYLPIFYIAGSQTLPPPLSHEEEEKLIKKLSEENNLEARQILVERNLRLVVYIAKKFENTGIGIEDLISIGTIGLMKGVNTFNTGKNIKLATYASRCIENEILMFLRKSNKLKGEISIDEPLNKDGDGNELLLSDILGTEPDITSGIGLEDLISIGTIGLMKGVNTFNSEKKIKLATYATYASMCIENEILMFLRKSNKIKGEISIDEPLNKDRDGNELLLSDILGTEPDVTSRNLEDEVDKILLRNSIAKLKNREKDIMEMRFGFKTGNEKTQKEVADELRYFSKLYI